jgi:hypothetical protein
MSQPRLLDVVQGSLKAYESCAGRGSLIETVPGASGGRFQAMVRKRVQQLSRKRVDRASRRRQKAGFLIISYSPGLEDLVGVDG